MGMIHYLAYRKLPGVKVVALCEVNERRLAGDWTDIKGNFGPPGAQMDLSGIMTTTRLDEMLRRDDIDLIDVTLPPSLHADAAVAASRAGKHVFCEKPMALRLDQCEAMSRAAAEAERLLMVGHVLPFFPEYAWALDAVRHGAFGRLLGGSFRRVISDPAWLRNYWTADQVGGPLFDLHVHDAHFIRLLFGMPQGVVSRGRLRGDLPEFWNSQFDFGSRGPTVLATSGALPQAGRSFNHGFEIHCERGTLLFEFAVFGDEGKFLCPPTLLTADGSVERPDLGSGDPMQAFEAELREVVNCVRENRPSAVLGADLACDAIRLCEMQAASIRNASAAS
jgi:predicted dehydrogenase